jgi:hypothetical protein
MAHGGAPGPTDGSSGQSHRSAGELKRLDVRRPFRGLGFGELLVDHLGDHTIDLRFSCGPGGSDCGSFVIECRCNGGIWNAFFLTLGCTGSPLNVQGGNTLDPLANCTGCGNQQLNVTVTT